MLNELLKISVIKGSKMSIHSINKSAVRLKKLAVTWLDYSPGLGHEKTKEGYYMYTPAGDG